MASPSQQQQHQEEVTQLGAAFGWTAIPPSELDDCVQLLGKARAAFEAVQAMDDYQPRPDLNLAPRNNVHFPDAKDNPLGAWAYRCECTQSNPNLSSSSSSSSSTTTARTLEGKTICFKDNIAVAGVPCLLGTSTLKDQWVPTTDATVVTRCLAARATVAGKAVCENLSRGAVSNTASTGPVDNPYAKGYSAGGSSSGTAALVASEAVDMGIGCDQGGSIRIPAALCGLYGFKATLGLVPYTGIASNDASVDFVGPITRTAMDCAVLLEAIAGVDGLDDRQIAGCPFPGQVPRYAADVLRNTTTKDGRQRQRLPLQGVKMGILKEGLAPEATDPHVKAKFLEAVKIFEKLGVEVVEDVSVPIHTQARTIYTVMSKMGNHVGMLGKATGRRQVMLTDLFENKDLPYTPEVIAKMNTTSKDGLLAGELGWQKYSQAYYKSVNLMRKVKDMYDEALEKVDFLVMPTCVTPSNPYPSPTTPPLEQAAASAGKLENTSPFNGSGHPALAMPIGFVPAKEDANVMMPASLQIVGRYWDEAAMLKAAYAWETAQDWKKL